MKHARRLLLVFYIIVLLVAVLWAPATTSAAPKTEKVQKLATSGYIADIDEGDVEQTPSGHWIIKNRSVMGQFIEGQFAPNPFTLSYDGWVMSALTQKGVVKGEMNIGDALSADFVGRTEITDYVNIGAEQFLPKLSFEGTWRLTEGAKGAGQFSGWFVFVPIDGHIVGIFDSAFTVTGVWQQ